jgi:hypothetical protein
MSNVNNPFGLRPVMRTMAGGNPNVFGYAKAAAYSHAIFKWDPVTQLAGVLNGPASGMTAGTTRPIGVALAYSLASLAATMLVMDDPGAIFCVQGDGSGSGGNIIDATTVGYNANLNYTGTAGGGVTRDNSGVQLTESTIAVTATLDVRILRLHQDPTNAYGLNGIVEVVFNKHLNNKEVTTT